jgi:type I restriction enzyme S subunit
MRQIRLGDFLEVQAGFAFKTEYFTSGEGVPLIRIRDLDQSQTVINYSGEYKHDFVVNRGDYLIGMDGNFRCYRWQGEASLLNQRVCRLRNFREGIEPEYVFYGIQRKLQEIENNTSFVTVKHLSAKQVQNIEMPLPPLNEQRRIVDLLSRAEGIVRLRREAEQKAAELIPALFLDMFGDPATNPKRWPLSTLGEILCDGPQNGLYKHASHYGDGTPILRIDAFYDGKVTALQALKRVRVTPDERSKFRLGSRNIVINRVNSPEYLGKSAIIPVLDEETVFESNMMRFAPDESLALPEYVIDLLQTAHAKAHFLSKAKHAINQSSINQQDVKSLRVPLPPLDRQRAFTAWKADIFSIQSQQSTATVKAQATFDALLAQAFSG